MENRIRLTREIVLEYLRQNPGQSFTPSQIAFTLSERFHIPALELGYAVTSLAADRQVNVCPDWRISYGK